MFRNLRWIAVAAVSLTFLFCATVLKAQGNSGSIDGVVKDPSGLSVPGAKVEFTNPVSGFHREATTDTDGVFRFTNIPFNPYHLVVAAAGFNSHSQDVDVRSTVPTSVQISLKVGAAETSVTVEAGGPDLIENDPSFHTDVDTTLTERLPLESQSSAVSSLDPGLPRRGCGLQRQHA